MFDLFLSLPILLFLDQLLLDIDSKSSNQFEGFVWNGYWLTDYEKIVWREKEKTIYKNEWKWNKEERKIKVVLCIRVCI